jgi:hypothetical protein
MFQMNSFTNKFSVGVPVFEADGCYRTKHILYFPSFLNIWYSVLYM